jgi:hypothetical protein
MSAETKAWQRFTRILKGDEGNPYSPALCILLLLITGLIIKIGPPIHQLLAQN